MRRGGFYLRPGSSSTEFPRTRHPGQTRTGCGADVTQHAIQAPCSKRWTTCCQAERFGLICLHVHEHRRPRNRAARRARREHDDRGDHRSRSRLRCGRGVSGERRDPAAAARSRRDSRSAARSASPIGRFGPNTACPRRSGRCVYDSTVTYLDEPARTPGDRPSRAAADRARDRASFQERPSRDSGRTRAAVEHRLDRPWLRDRPVSFSELEIQGGRYHRGLRTARGPCGRSQAAGRRTGRRDPQAAQLHHHAREEWQGGGARRRIERARQSATGRRSPAASPEGSAAVRAHAGGRDGDDRHAHVTPPIRAGETWSTELSGIELPGLQLLSSDAGRVVCGPQSVAP